MIYFWVWFITFKLTFKNVKTPEENFIAGSINFRWSSDNFLKRFLSHDFNISTKYKICGIFFEELLIARPRKPL